MVFGGGEFVEAELDGVGIGAEVKGAEEAIPEGKEGGVVGVGFRLEAGVMHFMEEGSDNEKAEGAVERGGDGDVGVVELDDGEHGDFVEGEFPDLDASECDDGDAEEAGEGDLTDVEAMGGGDIHEWVGVMNAMEAPEERDAVVEAVPGVHPEIDEEEGGDEGGPGRQCEPVQKAKGVGLGPIRGGPPEGNANGGVEGGVDETEAKIAGGVANAVGGAVHEKLEVREKGLPGDQQDKDDRAGGSAGCIIHPGVHGMDLRPACRSSATSSTS